MRHSVPLGQAEGENLLGNLIQFSPRILGSRILHSVFRGIEDAWKLVLVIVSTVV